MEQFLARSSLWGRRLTPCASAAAALPPGGAGGPQNLAPAAPPGEAERAAISSKRGLGSGDKVLPKRADGEQGHDHEVDAPYIEERGRRHAVRLFDLSFPVRYAGNHRVQELDSGVFAFRVRHMIDGERLRLD